MCDEQIKMRLESAEGYIELGMLNDAVRELESIPKDQRMGPNGLSVLLELYRASEDWALMEAVALLLLESDSENVDRWIDVAIAKRLGGRVEKARDFLLQTAEFFPRTAMVHFHLACCECQLGNIASAKEHLAISKDLCLVCRVLALTDEHDLRPLWSEYNAPKAAFALSAKDAW
ncbi:MAG: tetratricopeptide repeat protein [Terrimicrobiaceae bacterium]|jgi:lipopolysaccharide biosynthesis regulator YciM